MTCDINCNSIQCVIFRLTGFCDSCSRHGRYDVDGDRDVFMTIKLMVGGLPSNTLRAKILVQDNDREIPTHVEHEGAHYVCRSTSDPQLLTAGKR